MTKQTSFIKLTLLSSSLLLIANSYAINNNADTNTITASYDSSSMLLSLPIVSVDNSLFYQVEMQLISTNPTLLKITQAPSISSSDTVSATYNSSTSILSIPELSIDGVQYTAQLKRDSSLSDYQFELLSFSETSTYKMVDTGQITCHSSVGVTVSCTNSGQDGAYSGNQPSYTNNNDGTITDNVTALIWQQSPDTSGDGIIDSTDKLSQSAAQSYCSNLTLASQSDWRLPDIKTMYSLIDFSGEDVGANSSSDTSSLTPFINTTYFDFAYGDTDAGERIIDVQYATTTNYVSTTMEGNTTMFGVNMADGRIKGYGTSIGNSENTFIVQCVRGNEGYAINSFSDNNDDTISDNATGLMWQKNDSSSTKDWDEAISYCESDTTASYSDWRLPNAKELQGLVDYTRSPDTTSSAAINALFNATSLTNEAAEKDWGYYWSSTTHLNSSGDGGNAVYIAFGRALGYRNDEWLDVHGAGAQRSNIKVSSSQLNLSYGSVTDANGNEAIYHGPQGDVVRTDNYVRCVR